MKVNYPESILSKSEGTTDSEQYLGRLCNDTFLSLWSYPNVYRDQGRGGKGGDGKEVCDLLVVFENHIIIFSDKYCEFPNSGDVGLDWSRWYKRAVEKSAHQLWGAEKWILDHKDLLYLDKTCTNKFPLDIPNRADAKVHRIVIAHGASKRCKKELGGSGSLMIYPHITGDEHVARGSELFMPFAIGQVNPEKGYVHVFDDTTLEIVMKTLDTISDFVQYLDEKERFIAKGLLRSVAGEEDLLAHYLQTFDAQGNHTLEFSNLPPGTDSISLGEGFWEDFVEHPQRKAQVKENLVSYAWDTIIQKFIYHVTTGTSDHMTHPDIKDQEKIFRVLAKENRTKRRILGKFLVELVSITASNQRATRTVFPFKQGDPYYLFFLLPKTPGEDNSEYRRFRRVLLEKYCMVVKLRNPEALDIVGIATESGNYQNRSEDIMYLDARNWTEEENDEARLVEAELKEHNLLAEGRYFKNTTFEYPRVPELFPKEDGKGRDRNKPCHCGSGKKFKKCCGRKA